jgi:HEAT repeat protein
MTKKVVVAITADDAAVRQAALKLFFKLPEPPKAFRRLLMYLTSVASGLRDLAFAELAKHGDPFAELLMNLFKKERDPVLRLQALNLAKALKHPKLAPVFLHELKNPDWLVRYTAMQVLAEMKSPQALPALIEALREPETAQAAIQALDKYRDLRLAKPFFQKLPHAPESEQVELLAAIQNLGDARLLAHLGKFLDSSAPKGKAKLRAAVTIIAICGQSNTAVPERVQQIYDSLRTRTVEDLPDLGLQLADP